LTSARGDALGEPLGDAVGAPEALPDGVGPGGAAVAAALLPISAATVIALTVVNARISLRG
jgi:hypothetical protein